MNVSGYEQAVMKRRSDPEQSQFVRLCYLDDPLDAARRFVASDEFAEVRRILSLNSRGAGGRVLDVGAGNGIASFAFAWLGCEVVALEPDPSVIVGGGALAQLLPHVEGGTITLVPLPVEAFSNPGDGFDIVYLRQAAHHFPELEVGLARCVEHLKPGGVFLMTREHVADTPQDVEQFKQQHRGTQYGILEQAYSTRRYREAMRAAGLRRIQEWGSFDSAINYYPLRPEQTREKTHAWIRRHWGRVGVLASRIFPAVERWGRHRMSLENRTPGRLHSFLGVKGCASPHRSRENG